jgi:chorismate-pyruvate lyase
MQWLTGYQVVAVTNGHEMNGAFDPFRDLILTQDARPPQLSQVNLRALTPFQRALLAADGTVTKLIEAYMLEPVEVTLLKQETQVLAKAHYWLETPAQTEVIARQSLLRGRYSATAYAYAVSLLVPQRLPQTLLKDLASEPAGLGRILLNSQIENRREILWYGREVIEELPQEIQSLMRTIFISRTYRIITGGKPAMLINEKFPADLGN